MFQYECTYFARPINIWVKFMVRNWGFEKSLMNYRLSLLVNISKFFKKNKYRIETNLSELEKYLDYKNLKILNDHKKLNCKKFLIINKENLSDNIFVIFLIKKKKIYQCFRIYVCFRYIKNAKKLEYFILTNFC